MTEVQKGLLKEIREKFDPQTNQADRFILYEVTDFKDECLEAAEFWDQYEDFYQFGDEYKSKKKNFVERISSKVST